MARKKKKKKTFGDVLTTILMVAALCVFVYSGYTLYGFYKEYKKGSDEYDNLENSFALEVETEDFDALEDDEAVQVLQQAVNGADPDDPDAALAGLEQDAESSSAVNRETAAVEENGRRVVVPVMKNPIDFAELQRVNEDIVGWLKIRALDISYPVVQGEDNDFYLHRTFEKTDNFAGCLFFNCDNKADLTDQNTIVYGHNMRDGSMFGKLKKFREDGVFEKSKFFWIFTPKFVYQYRIFSASVVDKVGITYQTSFRDEEFDDYIKTAFENSEVDNTGVEVTKDDRIVTLSTCTGDDATRFVVLGKLAQVYLSK